MSRRNGGDGGGGGGRSGRGARLDLKLHLSPPRAHTPMTTESSINQSIMMSPTSSCLSSELVFEDTGLQYSSSPEATSMMLVGCPRCLMYIMLAQGYPRCPKCKSTVLLDVVHANAMKTKNS